MSEALFFRLRLPSMLEHIKALGWRHIVCLVERHVAVLLEPHGMVVLIAVIAAAAASLLLLLLLLPVCCCLPPAAAGRYFYDITDRAEFKANPDYKGVCHVALAQVSAKASLSVVGFVICGGSQVREGELES